MENMSNSSTFAIDMSNAELNVIEPLPDEIPPPPEMQRQTTTIFHVDDSMDVAPPPHMLQRATSINNPTMIRYFTEPIVDVPWTPPQPNRTVGYAKTYHSVVCSMDLSKELPTYITGMAMDSTVILDETGSMESMGCEPVQSVNSFIDGQRESGFSGLYIKVIRFNEFIYYSSSIPVTNYLAITDYIPRGMTALFDAITYAILTAEKAQHVIIVTDGKDNSSIITLDQLNTLIQRAESCGWTFTYVGCTPDAFEQGQQIKMNSKPIYTEGCGFDEEGMPPRPPTLTRALTSASEKVAAVNRARSN